MVRVLLIGEAPGRLFDEGVLNRQCCRPTSDRAVSGFKCFVLARQLEAKKMAMCVRGLTGAASQSPGVSLIQLKQKARSPKIE